MSDRHLWMLGVIGLMACAHVPPPPVAVEAEPPPQPAKIDVPSDPGLRLEVLPADAELDIDGRSYGQVSGLTLAQGVLVLRPGVYQVSLKQKGFVTWRAEVAVGEKVELLKVQLVRR